MGCRNTVPDHGQTADLASANTSFLLSGDQGKLALAQEQSQSEKSHHEVQS